MLKETLEKVKHENIILNVDLYQYKMLGLNSNPNDTSIHEISTKIQSLKLDLESCKIENEKLKAELNSRGKRKINEVPKWILEAKTKNIEGPGYNNNKSTKKVYVDLPSSKVCSFCGKSGYLKFHCLKREQHEKMNQIYVDCIWIRKYDSCIIDKEPKDD